MSVTQGTYSTASLRRRGLVVADLPGGAAWHAQLRALAAARAPGELLAFVQRPEKPGPELLWAAIGGLAGGGGRALTSQTTEQRGLIAGIDLAPTILRHLGLPIPTAMRGRAIRTDGPLDSARLRALKARLQVIYPRRLPALACLLGAWALLALACSRSPRGRARALRVGALALLWAPVATLVPAALEPGPAGEYALIVLVCLALGALADRLLAWPRALLAPALAAVAAIGVDALAGTQLSIRSLLGPDPALGVRFYGIGNELKSGLAVLVFAAVAAALRPSGAPGTSSRRASGAKRRVGLRDAWTMALAGAGLALVEGSARIGAGVGGVVLVSAGTAVAVGLLLRVGPSPVRPGYIALAALLAPILGLGALAALDLATAHGAGHYTGSVLHAGSAGELGARIAHRYRAAFAELRHGAMGLATAVALLAAGLGVRRRERLLAPVGADPVWSAALAGGLTAGVVGALVEDSGPVLLVVAVFALGCVLAYLWGRSPDADLAPDSPRETSSGVFEVNIGRERRGVGV